MSEATKDAGKMLLSGDNFDGLLGRRAQLGNSLDVIKENAKGLNVFEESTRKGRVGAIAFRAGGVAVGSAMTLNALFQGKDGEGNERSWVGRVVQGGAGIGIAAGSLLVGKGR